MIMKKFKSFSKVFAAVSASILISNSIIIDRAIAHNLTSSDAKKTTVKKTTVKKTVTKPSVDTKAESLIDKITNYQAKIIGKLRLIFPSITIHPAIAPNLGDLNTSLTSATPTIFSLISGFNNPDNACLISSIRS